MPSFDLVHERWIPLTVPDGSVEVSLHDALVNAHEYTGLDTCDPLQAVAVFRHVLLAVYLDAFGVPRTVEEWEARWQAGRLDPDVVGGYLERHRSRFDLFDESAPFGQVGGLQTLNGETKPASFLVPAIATGNSVPLFSCRTDATPPAMTAAAAARAVLSAQCWDTAAIKPGAVADPAAKAGKTTGNPTGPLGQLGVVIPLGRTLAQTLLLNTPTMAQGLATGDAPTWRRPQLGSAWQTRAATGLLDLLTFPARRVRLLPDAPAASAGDVAPVTVSKVVLTAGDRLHGTPEIEPHTQWRLEKKPKPGEPPRRPMRHQPGRAAWRGLSSLLATSPGPDAEQGSSLLLAQLADLRAQNALPPTLPLDVLVVGVAYGNQSAVVEDVISDRVPLPIAALDPDGPVRELVDRVVTDAETLRTAANLLGDDLRRASGGEPLAWDKSLRLGEGLLHLLAPTVHRLLTGLQRQPELVAAAETAWALTARRAALDAAEDVIATQAPTAFLGRIDDRGRPVRLATALSRYRGKVFATFPVDRYPDPHTQQAQPASAGVTGGIA